ncbi:hypothetical protein FVR03_18540 [Pontibacter qinzhouensis]|uniref:UspA domain-containing protein n=1 Tax=Pontibacter qinzhouensis TaxID=2603253 RepID=A0A5C8JA12_9BACT|nr:universal stress protein [Pontibacter qinzhouensis]TXK33803.1 hypothetical protein FVR03_18540 [Pontibacter qinzhouensis]
MKNILFSTDLSKNACKIALYAAELCRHVGARLIIFHAYEPSKPVGKTDLVPEPATVEHAVQAKMDNLTRKLKQVPGLSITRLTKPHLTDDETLYIARKVKADLVIMSTGSLSLESVTAAQVTLRSLSEANIPALLVPAKASFSPYSRVALFEETGEQQVNCIGINFLRHLSDATKDIELIKHLHASHRLALAVDGVAEQTEWPVSTDPALAIINGAQHNLAPFVRACQPELIVLPTSATEDGIAIASRIKSVQNKFIPILLVPPAAA